NRHIAEFRLRHRNVRRAIGVETLRQAQAPRLTLGALGLRPDDRLPVRREDQVAAGEDLYAVAARFVAVEEEAMRHGVLGRPGLDGDAVFEEDVRRAQD